MSNEEKTKAKFKLINALGDKINLKIDILDDTKFEKADGYYINNDDSKEGYKAFNATSLEFFISNLKENTNYRITGYLNGNIPIEELIVNTTTKVVEPTKPTPKPIEPKPLPTPTPNKDSYICSVSIKINDVSNINVKDQVEEINGELKETTTKLDSTTSDIKLLKDKINLSISSEQLESTKTLLNQDIDKVKKDTDEKINNINLEVTRVNRRATSIEANLDGITSKSSKLESNVEKVNGKLNTYESRLITAEQKITPSSIIGSVSSELDSRYASRALVELTSNQLKADFSNSGGYNMILDSKNRGGNNWIPVSWSKPNGGDYTKIVPSNINNECLSFEQRWANSSGGAMSKPIQVQANKTYTLALDYCAIERGSSVILEVMCWSFPQNGTNVEPNIAKLRPLTINASGFQSCTFTIPNHTTHINLYFWTKYTQWNSKLDFAYVSLNNLRMNEGKFALPWSPHPSECYEGIIKLDGNGFKCNFSDGAYLYAGHNGLERWKNGMARPYHYINHYVIRPQIRNGALETIVLPEDFQGKDLNKDFIIVAQHGDIDSNVGARFQKDAIRNIFIKIISWNSSSRQLIVQPCMQKIGVVTATHWGWDANTTTPGKTIGEGAIDVIIMAQM